MSTNQELLLKVYGMHCQSCVDKIEAALQATEGVLSAEVSLAGGQARIEAAPDLQPRPMLEAVSRAGDYRAENIPSSDAPENSPSPSTSVDEEEQESLYPLFLIVGFITGTVVCIALAAEAWQWPTMMRHFMAGFFLVFSFFKLLDLSGFVTSYRGYDLIAKRFLGWAYAYPFVELALGILYLLNLAPVAANSVTLVLMVTGALGVFLALRSKQSIRCACLGTALNLPMTTVTLVEDLTMALMAAVMLWHLL